MKRVAQKKSEETHTQVRRKQMLSGAMGYVGGVGDGGALRGDLRAYESELAAMDAQGQQGSAAARALLGEVEQRFQEEAQARFWEEEAKNNPLRCEPGLVSRFRVTSACTRGLSARKACVSQVLQEGVRVLHGEPHRALVGARCEPRGLWSVLLGHSLCHAASPQRVHLLVCKHKSTFKKPWFLVTLGLFAETSRVLELSETDDFQSDCTESTDTLADGIKSQGLKTKTIDKNFLAPWIVGRCHSVSVAL